MKTYLVTFIERYSYGVEVDEKEDMDEFDLEEAAVDKAYELYEIDKRQPIACFAYDELEIEEVN